MSCRPPVDYANPRDLAQVAEPLRSPLWTAIHHAPRGGLVLVSGRRSPWQQYLLRQAHGCRGRECDSGCKGSPTTARPGTSRHENTGAIRNGRLVAAADMGGIDLGWFHDEFAAKVGLHFPVPGERWHAEVDPNGKITVPIIPFGSTPNVNDGHHWTPFGPGDFDGVRGPIYKRGGFDNQVAEFQIRIRKLRDAVPSIPDPGKVDGIFGSTNSRTADASRGFHLWVIAMQQLTGQPQWPEPTAYVGPKKIAMLRWWTA